MKRNYKVSTFIHVFDDNTLWDAINKQKICLEKNLIQYVKNNKGKHYLLNIPEQLIKEKIIITLDEEKELIKALINQTTDSQFQNLFLVVTTNCNLKCDYCFYNNKISGSLQNCSYMSKEIAQAAIKQYKKIVSNNLRDENYWQQITFYGGEPSLNSSLLKSIIPFVRKEFDNETRIVVNTNLTIYDKDLFEIYEKNGVEVQVSIDGMKKQHDKYRHTRDGRGTYDIVMDNIKILLNKGVNVVPLVTASDANIDNFSEILLDLTKKIKIKEFGVNILIANSYQVSDNYAKTLAKEMCKAYEIVGNSCFDSAFIDLYEGILGINKQIVKNSCGCGRKITVFPNGKVLTCQALERHAHNYMGYITQEIDYENGWLYWRERSRFKNEKCLNCEAVGSCGGGCAMGSYNKYGTIHNVDFNQCEFTKTLFRLLHNKEKY